MIHTKWGREWRMEPIPVKYPPPCPVCGAVEPKDPLTGKLAGKIMHDMKKHGLE